jgi:filamentous hemagglutinin family protein
MTALALTVPPRRRRNAPRRTLISMAVALALAQYGSALAGPGGAQVVSGQVAVSRPTAQQTVVTQGSANAIVNWQQFSIARNESVDFRQPGTASVILNRVTGSNPSEIYGRLSANGQVFLVNPGGVLFGRTAQVSVGGLVASTLDIDDADFLGGRYRFAAGATGGTVVNQGVLQAAERGTVALLGAKVNNDGTISAQLGTAALVAGDKIALDFNGDGLTKIRVDKAAVAALVDNRGMVVADGGQAILTAHAAQALAETVLNQQGVVRARSLVERNGKILLDGGERGATLASGTLDVSGTAPGLKGGTAEVLGHHVGLFDDALIDARGDAGGGTILVGGDYGGANPLVRNASATFAGPKTALRADAIGSGDGGKVILWSDNATRVFGTVSAGGGPNGGNGGFIETSGKFLDVAGARISAAAPRGKGGQWLLDPYSITIDNDGPSNNVGDGPEFTSTGPAAHVSTLAIEGALNNGVDVTVTTGGDSEGVGDINVNSSITKSAGTDTTLTLNAAGDINVGAGVRIAAGAPAGKLHVNFNADADASGAGAITMAGDSAILTNGGALRMYGESNQDSGRATGSSININGVFLDGAVIDTTASGNRAAGGAVLIRGRGVTIGDGDNAVGAGVWLIDSGIQTASGSVTIDGIAGDLGEGVFMQGGRPFQGTGTTYAVVSDSGAIGIKGNGGNFGVRLDGAHVLANVNSFNLPPIAGGTRAQVNVEGTGGVTGVSLLNKAGLGNIGGPIRVTGFGGGIGVSLVGESVIADLSNGAIDIRGRAGQSGGTPVAGVYASGSTISTFSGDGAIAISGESLGPAPGVLLESAFDLLNIIGGPNTTGNIAIRASNVPVNGVGGDMIQLGGTIATRGTLVLSPGGVSAAGGLTAASATQIDLFASTNNFSIDQVELTQVIQPSTLSVVIGSATHTGPITVAAGADLAGRYNLTLQNGGSASAGIALAGGFANAGKLLTLSSGGTVTQGGPIVAGSLLLHGTQPESNFQLTDALNAVGTFSARFDAPKGGGNPNFGDVNFVNSGDLTFGKLAGTGFDAGANLPVAIRADDALVAGDLFAHAGHDLILNQNIGTGASDITLVADHVFLNPANASLTPGGGGRWRVFADTWVGENPGTLVGTGPLPNLYNCGYGAPCTAALPATGNVFVYRQQPRVDIALNESNPNRIYGSPNPAFNFTASGLVKQDKVGAAVTGAYSTNATATSNVQSYPIDGQFISPAGYLVVAAPGTLRVDPATLTYVAAPSVRLAGSPGQPLTGRVTGFVAGDTLEGATTGTPGFSTPAGPAAPPGRYAINGAGLAARNYVFMQALSNATALTVEPSIFGMTPSILKDVTFESSALYGKNFGVQRLCAGTGPLARANGAPDSNDPLAIEWSRVKDNPNLSNCIGLVQRFSCDNF